MTPASYLHIQPVANTTASVTHLLWVGRWIEVTRVWHEHAQEWAWRFKNGRDAADWLLS